MMWCETTSFQKCRKVHDHQLNSLRTVAVQYDDIIVDDDRSSMVLDNSSDLLVRLSGSKNVTVTYFEGLNILVRIPGTSKMSGAILLSAHFDSVSTALGSTVFSIVLYTDQG